MNDKKNNILIIHVHPTAHKSRINAALINGVRDLESVTIRHLYELYPDFHVDVKKEQEQLIKHDIIVFQHPFYWYSAPALLKALMGKKLMTATSTGGTRDAYREKGHNHYTMGQFLAPYRQTASLCKMEYLPPYITHGSLLIEDAMIRQAADEYKKVIVSLRDKLFNDEELMKFEYINELLQ